MRRMLITSLLVLAVILQVSSGTASVRKPLEVFLIDPCGGCLGSASPGCGECKIEDEIYLRYRDLLAEIGQEGRPIKLNNLRRTPERYENLVERLKAAGYEQFRLPILLIDDVAFPAEGQADELVRAYLLTKQKPGKLNLMGGAHDLTPDGEASGRSMIYLYSKYCEDCRAITPWLKEQLPDDVSLLSFDIASQEGLKLQWAVEAHFNLSEGDFFVPALISGETLLLGEQDIREELLSALAEADKTQLDQLIEQD